MATQDDIRENEMIALFKLEGPFGRSSPHDALLKMKGGDIPLQLKSATTKGGSVSTARDVGTNHISKWRKLHWLFGFYSSGALTHCIYAPPDQMCLWLDELEQYIAPDVNLAELAARAIRSIQGAVLKATIGTKAEYTEQDVRRIAKKSMKASQYAALGSSVSRDTMLNVLARRIEYIAKRGATLNNPHISARFFKNLPRIMPDPRRAASELRHQVKKWREGDYQVIRPAGRVLEEEQ